MSRTRVRAPPCVRRGITLRRSGDGGNPASVLPSADRESEQVKVLTVDDQAVFRRVARALVAATPGFENVGQARSGREALRLADELAPDLVLLDVRMPGMDGIETARHLTAAHPSTVVVLVSVEELPALQDVPRAAHLRKRDLSTHALRSVWDANAPVQRATGSR